MNSLKAPVTGSTCTTEDVPVTNGNPRNNDTKSRPSEYTMAVGTPSTCGPPSPGKADSRHPETA